MSLTNQTPETFATTVTQTSSLSVALTIPQGGRSIIYGNGTSFCVRQITRQPVYTQLGHATGKRCRFCWRFERALLQVKCGTAPTWSRTRAQQQARLLQQYGQQLRLFRSRKDISSPSNTLPVYNTDFSSTSLFYVPFQGNWTVLSNGTALYSLSF